MKRTFLFFACVMASISMLAQSEQNDYISFVEKGKQWHVVRTSFGAPSYHSDMYRMNEEVIKDGKTYMTMYRSEDLLAVIYVEGLLREEDRKVYFFDTDMQKEFLMFDYSLKEGDAYETYSYDEQKMVTYKVLSVGDYVQGPKVARYDYDEQADSMNIHQRHLQYWTVCRTDNESIQKTWIEGVGSLEGPLENLYDYRPVSSKSYLAYVFFNDIPGGDYFPFSFYDTLSRRIHGCNMSTCAIDNSEDWHDQFTYDLVGDRLHVYGKAVLNCGCYNYVFVTEEPTEDPLVHKLYFNKKEVGPLATCANLFGINFYVPGFDPNLNYIVVDDQGKEHPVINRTPQNNYRPFIEDDKVWKVGSTMVTGNLVKFVEYYYFDGDTIINGKTCKQMMRQRYVNPEYSDYAIVMQYPLLQNVGAWYEEDQKVYFYNATSKRMKMMYDFSLNAYDTLKIDYYDIPYIIGPKQTGGIKGYKDVYRNVMMLDEYNTTWLEGVGGIDGPTTNLYYGYENHPKFLMSCTVGDEVIYLNDEYEDGASPDALRHNARRLDFTHTIKTKPKAPMRREAEQSLYGEYNDLRLGINLDPLDDTYLVRITDKTGIMVYEKAINAGNIVGLNIDISTYAKGRYTITVENSQEVFTGEFEAQTTGIEEVRSKRSEVRSVIYNLQGQRLSSLQKGLNIVNGQKIFVK